MKNNFFWQSAAIPLFFILIVPSLFAAETKSATQESLERRERAQILGFFLKDPKDATIPRSVTAINLYNDAVNYFQSGELKLARMSLEQSLKEDSGNVLGYELLGDIDNLEQNLEDAKSNYEIAYNLRPTTELKSKIEKLKVESKVEKSLATYNDEHFFIKYFKNNEQYEGFELRELLRKIYRNISKDFAYYFTQKIVVLLYDDEDFKAITQMPHWVSGVYDGKVRMPINSKGLSDNELQALAAHEVTHAFIAAMSSRMAPAWINEGLAVYEEDKVRKTDQIVFESAVKTKRLLPLDELMSQNAVYSMKDPLQVALFYQQSFQFVRYLVDKYGMFRVKELLKKYGERKNSDEAIRSVFKTSIPHLEKKWLQTVTK